MVLVGALAGGCVSAPKPEASPANPVGARNEGYATLYDLLGKQKHLGLLLKIKGEGAPVRAVVKEIARVSEDGHRQLKKFAEADPTLNFKTLGLSFSEAKTREAIESTRSKQLLRAGGSQFELHLLLSQNEALTYGAHLARVVRDLDTDPARQTALAALAQWMDKLHEDVVRLLQISPLAH